MFGIHKLSVNKYHTPYHPFNEKTSDEYGQLIRVLTTRSQGELNLFNRSLGHQIHHKSTVSNKFDGKHACQYAHRILK